MKLKDAWALLNASTDPEKIKLYQYEINKTESWCISNNFAGIKHITDWSTWVKQPIKFKKRYEGMKDGGHNIPVGALLGYDRCSACKYNFHSYCDRGVTKPCWANV